MKLPASAAFFRLRSSLFLPSVMVLSCAAIHTSQAADATWSVTGPAPWSTGSNWAGGSAPVAGDRALILNGGQATIATGEAISIGTLRLVDGGLNMTGGSFNTTTTSDADCLRFGDYDFNQTVGTVTLTMSGNSAITAADRIYLADGQGAASVVTNVTATLSDTASITATNDYVILGRNHGTANVTLTQNAVIEKKGTTNTFLIGDGAMGTGNVTLKDSSALKSANQFVIGNGGGSVGSVTLQNSSSLSSTGGAITIGNAAGSLGSVSLQDSATLVSSTGNIVLGNASTASGSIALKGTSALTFTGEIYVGNASGGTGTLTISDNATVTKTGTSGFVTAARSNGTGTITVEGSGKLISQNAIRLAEGATANATLNVKENAVVQVTNSLQVGYQGTGKAVVSDSAKITAGGMNIGFGATTGTGTLQMSGGTLTVGGALTVGTDGAKGSLLMTGGVLNATATSTTPPSYNIGAGSGSVATVTLSGNSVINAGGIKWKSGDLGGTGVTNIGTTAVTLNGSSALTLNQFTLGHLGGDTSSTNVTVNDTATLTVNDFITIGRDDNTTNGTMTVHLNLNGGTLATKSIRAGGGDTTATNNNIVANGGTIKALADQSDFFQATQHNSSRPNVSLASGGLGFNTNGFTVGVKNALAGIGGLTKTGAGKLSLTGSQTFTGTTTVSQGTLDLDTASMLSGPCVVSSGGTLSISGNSSQSAIVPELTFEGGSSLLISNLSTSSPAITAGTALNTSGTVTVSVSGALMAGYDYPLITHSGFIGGAGAGAFQVGSLGRGVVANLVDRDGLVTLHVSSVDPLIWKGNLSSAWDVDTTSNWTLSSAVAKYLQGDNLLFDDSATTTEVVLNTTVNPYNVTFNSSKPYTLSGTGKITGTTGLTKSGTGTLTLATANNYTGTTVVEGGTLKFGDGTSNGSIVGPLVVNESNIIFDTTGSSPISGTIEGYGAETSLTKIGSGTQTLTWTANTYYGPFNINEGTVKFGDGIVNGALGANTAYNIASGATLATDFATAVNFAGATISPWAKISGSGSITLNSAQPVNGSANWGELSLTPAYTGTLQVLKGRVQTASASAFGGLSTLKLGAGSQVLLFASTEPYTPAAQIAGLGWGEGGFNQGAIRSASVATWAGNVELTADSGIMAQYAANLTVTGSISGPYVCQFYCMTNGNNPGTLTIAPSASVQNSYGTTRIGGDTPPTVSETNAGLAGIVIAGNQHAFSTGPLEVTNASMRLNGYNFSFASLSGASGSIGNFSSTSPSVLTVGGASATTFGGTLVNGGTGTLSLVKNGIGTLTLTGANTYTGSTTIQAGTLSVSTAFLSDTAAVSIASGAVLNLNTNATLDIVGTLFLGGVQVPAGTYGASHPTYGAYFTGTGSLVVANGPSPAGYGTWATNAGLTAANNGLTADPDNDGITNLLEFYLNGNPLGSDAAILPTRALDATYLTLSFRRRDDAESDVATQVVEFGTNLTSWMTRTIGATSSAADANGVIVTVTENGASPDDIVVQIPRSLAPGGAMFARLKVAK